MRILVHCHVFYPVLWPELRTCVGNLPEDAEREIYLTMVEPHPEVERDALAHFPGAHILQVPNQGYDIAPFLAVCDREDLDRYDLILKLHTKRDYPEYWHHLNYFSAWGSRWRDNLLEFASTRAAMRQSLARFDDTQVGMVGNGRCLVDYDADGIEWDRSYINTELQYLNFSTAERAFFQGTMFLCRSEIMKKFQHRVDFTRLSSGNNHQISRAHCYEMLLGCAVRECGFFLRDYRNRPYREIHGGRFRRLFFRLLYKFHRLLTILKCH